MDIALLFARLLLAGTFTVSGLAKLADPAASRQALVDFGVPVRIAAPLGRMLPLAELVFAALLLPVATAWWAAVGVATLLLMFSVAIAINLARGRRPDCRCFGQLASGPIGPSTLFRNAALAAVAGFLIWSGPNGTGSSAVAWLGELTMADRANLVLSALALALLGGVGWLLLQVIRQQGRLLLRLDTIEARLTAGSTAFTNEDRHGESAAVGLPVGARAPSFSLPDLGGRTHTLESLREDGKPLILLFVDPLCGPCNALLPEAAIWHRQHQGMLIIAPISRGSLDENRAKADEHGLAPILIQDDFEVALAYESYGTPGAVLVRPDGLVGSPVAQGADGIRRLVQSVVDGTVGAVSVASPEPHHHGGNGAAIIPGTDRLGDPAPPIELPGLDGRTVRLVDFRDHDALVLFWNPQCGFCQQMLPELKAWESQPAEGAPRLFVVSAGSIEDNRALGLSSPIVLDDSFGVGRAYGATGTPMGVIVDRDGNIGSMLAAGQQAVMALAQRRGSATADRS